MDQFVAPTSTTPTAAPQVRADIANIFFLLDRSGSMSSIREQAISGFNQYINSQRDLGQTYVTLIQFDDVREVNYASLPIEQVVPLTTETFVPRGSTALNDSVGFVLSEQLATSNPEHTNILAILTDGAENASKEYQLSSVKELIGRAEAAGWEILFLGANMKAETIINNYGISRASNVAAFQANASGTASAFSTMSAGTTAYRGLKSAGLSTEAVDMSSLYATSQAVGSSAAMADVMKGEAQKIIANALAKKAAEDATSK